MPTKRVDEAIRMCLENCRGHRSPRACVAAFIAERRQAGWKDFDLRVVEKAVFRLLQTVIDPEPDKTMACPNCSWPESIVLMCEEAEMLYLCSDCQHEWKQAMTS